MKLKKFNEMATNRERLRLEDNEDNRRLFMGDERQDYEYEYIDEEHTYFDTEKGYSTYDVIFKRLSDGKYFKGEKTKWSAGGREHDFNCVEVFPKTITITKYE